jgi:hypothetical protein
MNFKRNSLEASPSHRKAVIFLHALALTGPEQQAVTAKAAAGLHAFQELFPTFITSPHLHSM